MVLPMNTDTTRMTTTTIIDGSAKIDGAGATCSALCAVHCATASLVPGALTFLGLGALVGPALETGFAALALLFAGLALWLGYRRHRARGVLVLFSLGMTGLVAGRVLEETGSELGSTATIFAGLLLVTAHGYSWWCSRRKVPAAATADAQISS